MEDIRAIVDGQSQTDPQFKTKCLYTRLTATEVCRQLIAQKGYREEELPTATAIASKLNEMGYYPTKVAKSKPQKKLAVNGYYPSAGKIALSFDVYDVAGNRNLAPNGIHTGTFLTTLAPVTYYPNPPAPTSATGQIDLVVQDYIGCVTDVFLDKLAEIPGLNGRWFKLLNSIYGGYNSKFVSLEQQIRVRRM